MKDKYKVHIIYIVVLGHQKPLTDSKANQKKKKRKTI